MVFAIIVFMETLTEKTKGLEKQMIINALQESNWIKAEAARMIGITERMIGYKIKKYGIKKEVGQEN
jgi:Nif-specific regulatory protein